MKKMKWTGLTFFLATLCIAGLPPFSGFVSKDEILWMAYSTPNPLFPQIHKFIWFLGVLGAFCTAFYMTRLTMLTFFGEYRGGEHSHDFHHEMAYEKVHEVRKVMWIPLIILMIGFCLLGLLGKSKIFSGDNAFHHWLAPVVDIAHANHGDVKEAKGITLGQHPVTVKSEIKDSKHSENTLIKVATFPKKQISTPQIMSGEEKVEQHEMPATSHEEMEKLEHLLMGLSVLVAMSGVLLGYLLYGPKKIRPPSPSREPKLRFIHRLLLNKYWVDEIYQAVIVNTTRRTSEGFLWKLFDVKFIDGTVNGVAFLAKSISSKGLRLQNGMVNSYAFFMVIGVAAVLGYMIYG